MLLALAGVVLLWRDTLVEPPWTLQGKPLEPIGPIYGAHTAVQTLEIAFIGPVVAFDVRFATYARRNAGTVTLHVRRAPTDSEDVRTVRVEAADLADNGLYRFRLDRPLTADLFFASPQVPTERTILRVPFAQVFLVFESSATTPGDAVSIWTTPDDTHPDGEAAYHVGASHDGQVKDNDLAVAVVYGEPLVYMGVVIAARHSPMTVLGSWLLVLMPGALLAFLVVDRRSHGIGVQLAIAPAFGVAIQPLIVLYATLGNVPIGRSFPWLVIAASGVGLLVLELRRSGSQGAEPPTLPESLGEGAGGRGPVPFKTPGWALILVFGLVAWGAVMRAFALLVAIPPGGDAFHHAVIAQLIVDRGSLPGSFTPYAPIESFSYHFGFHAYAALTALAGRTPALEAMTYSAIVLNALIGLSVFALARIAGVGLVGSLAACLVVELIGPFPAQLLDLARYPQSAALVIFPVFVAFILGYLGEPRSGLPAAGWLRSLPWRTLFGGALLGAGLFLTHYRVALFGVAIAGLLIAWTVLVTGRAASVRPLRHSLRDLARSSAAHAMLVLVGTAVLVSPWVLQLMRTFTLGIRGSEGRYGPDYYSLERLGDGFAQPWTLVLVGLGAAGIGLGVARRNHLLTVLGAWSLVQLALSNPHWIPVPLAGQVDTVTVVTSLFFPLALGVGFLINEAARALRQIWPRAYAPVLVGLFALAIVWGSAQLPGLIHTDRLLADARDWQAAQWIRANTAPDALFLVNAATRRWEPDFVVPTDGGYWLPLLARRSTTLLPMLYPAERSVSVAQIQRMERLANAAATDVASPDTIALLREMGVTHVYLGVAGGPIDERKLAASSQFRAIYRERGVSIYELVG